MSSQPLVSVALNNFNYARYLRESISSALNQSYRFVEVIVVDDGSTDDSRSVIESFGDRVASKFKTNGGQASALNAGFAMSRGDIVFFLDSDDCLFTDTVERVVAAWQPGIVKVQFPLDLMDEDGVSLGERVPTTSHEGDVTPIIRRFGSYAGPPSSGNAYARTALTKIFPMPEAEWRISADTYPILITPFFGAVRALPQPGGRYRIQRKSTKSRFVMNNAPATPSAAWTRVEHTRKLVAAELRRRGLFDRDTFGMLPPTVSRVRLISKVVDGGGVATASRSAILKDALKGVWSWPDYTTKARIIYTVWFVCVATLPLWMSGEIIVWAINPSRRPSWMRWVSSFASRSRAKT